MVGRGAGNRKEIAQGIWIRDGSACAELSRVRAYAEDSYCADARGIPGCACGPNGKYVVEKRPAIQMECGCWQGGSVMIAKTTFLAAILWLPLAGQTPLPGTAAMTAQGDFAAQMVDGINEYLLRATSESASKRAALWKRDYGSAANYERSIAQNLEHLKKITG